MADFVDWDILDLALEQRMFNVQHALSVLQEARRQTRSPLPDLVREGYLTQTDLARLIEAGEGGLPPQPSQAAREAAREVVLGRITGTQARRSRLA